MRFFTPGFVAAAAFSLGGRVLAFGESQARLLGDAAEDHGGSKTNPLNDSFKKYVEGIMKHYHVPGMSIGIVLGNETFSSGYGYARLDPKEEATADTLFYIGSITKNMVAATLLYVLESTANTSSPITLDTPVHEIIPDDFVLSDEHATLHATLKDILSHRLGYPRHEMSYGGDGFSVKDAVRQLRHLPMTKELREEFQYFNYGYMTAQHVIQTLTGKWIGDVHKEAIFGPLGMNSSTVRLNESLAMPHTLAFGYSWDDVTGTLNHNPWWDGLLVGAGGLITSANDYTKYLRAMINQDLPISLEMQDALVTPLMIESTLAPKPMSTMLYSTGWSVNWYRGYRFISHNGGLPGFTAIAGFLPDLKWGAVVSTNGDLPGTAASEVVFYRLLDDFLDAPADDRVDSVAKWDKIIHDKYEKYTTLRTRLFPDTPDPPLPLSAPLENYAGTYFNPGYRNLTFSVVTPQSDLPVAKGTRKVLHADLQSEWAITMDLEHVSGEHFISYVNTKIRSTMFHDGAAAMFELGADGGVARLGVFVEPALRRMIWFERIA